jgi:diketogulonate reductase-like aldo/keto reductase
MAFTLKSTARLPGGHHIPLLGLGVYQNYDAGTSVLRAVEAGYKHIDSAQAYRNEEAVGQGIAQASVKREDIFVSKEHSVG